MNISKGLRDHLPFILFYALLLFTGITIYDDYGVSWDESECRIDNGILNTNFIKTGDQEPLLNSISKYHGPAFEMFLVVIEKQIGLTSRHDIFLMRHLVTFFLFALSVLFFYMLCIKCFRSNKIALLGCAFLVLYPRIFADSFYNSKDLAFLSLVIINIYSSVLFFERKNIITAVFNAIVSAIIIDIRIMGVIIPCFTYLVMLLEFIRSKELRIKILISTIVFTAVLAGAIVLFWPVLWLGPVNHFMLAIKEMSKYPWDSKVLYNGEYIVATKLPWHYIPVWILISTPLLYLVLLVYGLYVIARDLFNRSFPKYYLWLNLYIFFVPVAAVIFLHSVVYDGWRHLFFIYPSIVIIILTGISSYLSKEKINSKSKNIFTGALILYLAYIAIVMIQLHPFENCYFNRLAGKSLAEAREKYEVDYWALSYKQGFEYILRNDTSSNIFVHVAEPQPGTDNMFFLPDEDRNRISITDARELADYYLTCYRYHHEISKIPADCRIMRDNGVIHSVFNLKNNKISFNENNIVAAYSNNNEGETGFFHPGEIILDTLSSQQNHIEHVSADREFGGNFSFNPPAELTVKSNGRKYLSASFITKSNASCNAIFIIQVDSANGKTYHWNANGFQTEIRNKWVKQKFIVQLPDIYSTADNVKIHIGNMNKNDFSIDDFTIKFYSIDEDEVEKVLAKTPI